MNRTPENVAHQHMHNRNIWRKEKEQKKYSKKWLNYFPNLMRNINLRILSTLQTWVKAQKTTPRHIRVKCWKPKMNMKSWKQAERKDDIQGTKPEQTSLDTVQAVSQRSALRYWNLKKKTKNFRHRIQYPAKMFFYNEGEIRLSHTKAERRWWQIRTWKGVQHHW